MMTITTYEQNFYTRNSKNNKYPIILCDPVSMYPIVLCVPVASNVQLSFL